MRLTETIMGPLQGAISSDEPFTTIVLWVFAVPVCQVWYRCDFAILELLRKLDVVISVGEVGPQNIRSYDCFDLDSKVVARVRGHLERSSPKTWNGEMEWR